MSSNDNGFAPVVDESGDVLDENGFSEDGSVEVVSDGSVGTLPHLLEFEFFNSSLIWSDGGALDSHFAFLDGFGCIHGDLVVSFISVFHAEVEVLDVEVEEGMDQLVLDLLPEDTSHLVSVKLSNWILDLDFLGGEGVGESTST